MVLIMLYFLDGIVWYGIFLFSLICHEAAHAWTAYKLGDDTAYEGGQVSLDPMPHIKRSVFGTVIVPILSYFLNGWMMGWGSAPYNPFWAFKYPKRSAWMALAGPGANFILVLISGIAIKVTVAMDILFPPKTLRFSQLVYEGADKSLHLLALVLSITFSLNMVLLFFNLLPLPPLDGSGIIPLFIDEDKGRSFMEMMSNPGLSLLGIYMAWNLFDGIAPYLFDLTAFLLYPGQYGA